jgi:hypothetical protein
MLYYNRKEKGEKDGSGKRDRSQTYNNGISN